MWLDTKQTKKWRSDSLEARLYAITEANACANGFSDAEAAAEGMEAVMRVMSWLYSRPSSVVVDMVAEEFGIETSAAALSGYWRRFADPFLSEQMRRASTAANRMKGELDTAGVQRGTVDLITQLAFEVMSSPNPQPGDVVKLTKLLIESRKQDLDERKVRLLEDNAARAKAQLAAVVTESKGGLTPETLKRIEEAAALL